MEEPAAVVFTKRYRQNNGLQKHAKQAPYKSKASRSTQSKHPTKKQTKPKQIQKASRGDSTRGANKFPTAGGRETERESEKRIPTRGPKEASNAGGKHKKREE